MMFQIPKLQALMLGTLQDNGDALREQFVNSLTTRETYEREITAEINRITTEFMLTGIATVASPYTRLPITPPRRKPMSWVQYVKELAHELHRPGVIVVNAWDRACWVHIQKRACTLPLAARFLLLPKDHHNYNTTRYWCFYVQSDSQELLAQWHADAKARRALMPP